MWNHWVARANYPHEPFKNFQIAQSVWHSFEKLFPQLVAAVLMPNHLHLILPGGDKPKIRNVLEGVLGSICKNYHLSKVWQTIPEPSIIPDLKHLRRNVRYVALNPCRQKLCSDPLEWLWSSYRDVMGATVNKRDQSLAKIFGELGVGFASRFHAYVSADPTVQVEGTPFPQKAPPKARPTESIGEILFASAAAFRAHPSAVLKAGRVRSIFIHLAHRQGWYRPKVLAEICNISPRAVLYIVKRKPPSGMDAAVLCLGDRRLRWAIPEIFPKAEI